MKTAIYIRLTKIGSKSIVRSKNMESFRKDVWINQQDGHGIDESLNASLATKRKVGDEMWSDSFKFTFVRNPFARVVSAWNYIMRMKFFRSTECGHEFENLSFREFWRRLADIDLSYPVGTCIYKENQKNPMWWHLTPLYQHIIDAMPAENKDGTIILDFIGKVENYQGDFNTICDRIGIPHQQLPHKNATKHKHYTEYYDDETMEIVAEKYAKDIEYFGYEFGK